MNDRPLGCSVFYSTLLPYGFTLKLFTFSWPIEKCVCIFVDKIDNQLKILWLSTFIDKLNLSIDNYRQISSIIDLSTTFSMIDFDRQVMSCLNRPSDRVQKKIGKLCANFRRYYVEESDNYAEKMQIMRKFLKLIKLFPWLFQTNKIHVNVHPGI